MISLLKIIRVIALLLLDTLRRRKKNEFWNRAFFPFYNKPTLISISLLLIVGILLIQQDSTIVFQAFFL